MKFAKRKLSGLLSIWLSVCLFASVLPLDALAAVAEYETYQTENGGFLRVNRFTATLDGAVNISGDLTIPSTVGTATVRHISDKVFSGNEELTSVTIPSTVQSIGDEAFRACINLKTVKLNEGLSTIGKSAFRYCYALTEINLPSSLSSIEDNTFDSCLALRSATIPENVKSLGTNAFYNCKQLTSISLPAGVTTIGGYAFSNCVSLVSVKLPKSLQNIPIALFSGCTALSEATVYGNVKNVMEHAFGNCTSLKKLVLPEGIQRISQWAFDGCENLEILSVPDSVTNISADAFNGCDKLTLYVNAATLAQVFASANKIPYKLGTLDGGGSAYPNTPFTDVNGHWAEEQIKWAYGKGYFNGVTATLFSPDTFVNRGMLVSLLYRMEGKPAAGTASFTDVSAKSYYADAVAWGESTGVVGGMGGGKYMPARSITREQLATMLYRYAQYKKMDVTKRGDLTGYKDMDKISSFAGTAMSWAVGVGVITGVTEVTLEPKGNATRAQTAVMLKRFADLQ